MNQIHPLAVVDPEAKLGDNNIIGPFCVIDKNVVMGDNNHLLNNVTIHTGARIGSGNEFFPGASISTKPQDLKFKGCQSWQDRCRLRKPADGEYAYCTRLCHR